MDKEIKQKIIEFNNKFGIQTEFVKDEDVLGYALKNKIYINENEEHDYEKTNKHELLHFFEDTPEFAEMKNNILENNKERIDKIRSDYELRYFGLYSEEEIKAGAIDNEIVIDIMTNNLDFEYENGLKVGDKFLGQVEKSIEEKRYMNLTLKANIKNMNLSDWEKIFVANYYDGKERMLPQGKDKIAGIKEDINNYLNELYNKSEDEMKIDRHSPEVIREFESEIKALRTRGEDINNIQLLEENSEKGYEKIASESEKHLYEEYKHIVDLLKGLDYEPAFKAMMLNETLTKIYKLDVENEEEKTIVKKRDLNNSIAGHMILNEQTLDVMYKNVNDIDQYDRNFANLYFASVEIFKNKIAEENLISLEGVETFNKGEWRKYKGKSSDEKNYLENAEKLATLVQDTPWCTRQLASSQLAEGDFYVFVDNDKKNPKPHIAVKMNGNSIDEVRGIKNGNAQELEEEYRDVAISFLENNKEIENGKEWYEKEEWNKRLIEYKKKIEDGTLEKEEVPKLLEDLKRKDYKSHGGENSNRVELKKSINKIKVMLAEYYGYYECKEEEIYVGDQLDFSELDVEVNPYKVIIGNAKFEDSKVSDIGKLKYIVGNADFSHSKIKSLGELESIGGDAFFNGLEIEDLGKLKSIGGNAIFLDSKIKDLEKLKSIGGNCFVNKINNIKFDFEQLEYLGGIIGDRDYYFSSSYDDDDYKKKHSITLEEIKKQQSKEKNILARVTKYLEYKEIIENRKEWYEKEEWNKRLIEYKKKIEEGTLEKEEVPRLVEDLVRVDYKSHDGENLNKVELKKIIGKAKPIFAQYYECEEEEIYVGDRLEFEYELDVEVNPYKVIIGNAKFNYSKVSDIGKLKYIVGDADFGDSKIKSLGELESIGGDAHFGVSKIKDLGKLKSIGGDAYFGASMIKSLGELENIGGDAYFWNSVIRNLGKLKSIAGECIVDKINDIKFNIEQLEYLGGVIREKRFYGDEIRKTITLEEIKKQRSKEKNEKINALAKATKDLEYDKIEEGKEVLKEITKEKDKEEKNI